MSINPTLVSAGGPIVELSAESMIEIQGGTIPAWGWAVLLYAAKQVGDNWNSFKEGLVEGFNAVAG